MSRLWRVHHPNLPARAGSRIDLGPDESHHVRRVLRLRAGERVGVFDGRGREWVARLVEAGEKRCVVELEQELIDRVDSRLPLSLYQAGCRPEKMHWVVQKACEIGVAEIHILESADGRRTWASPRRLQRLGRIAVEACKQSGRRIVPRIEVVTALPQVPTGERLALLLAPGTRWPLAKRMERSRPEAVSIAVGPEGGFDAGEVECWLDNGWVAASLGPRVLRTETAGLVAAAIVLHRWADVGRTEDSDVG